MFVLPRVNLNSTTTSSTAINVDVVADAQRQTVSQQHFDRGSTATNGMQRRPSSPPPVPVMPLPAPATTAASATAMATGCSGQPPPLSSLLHYSTEKSGSSGYYSSHVYSTSSFDEHIYSEPVSGDTAAQTAVLDTAATDAGKLNRSSELSPANQSPMTANVVVAAATAASALALLPAKMCRESASTSSDLLDRLQPFAMPVSSDQQQQQQQQRQRQLRHHQHHQLHHDQQTTSGLHNLESSIKNLELHLKAFSISRQQPQSLSFGDDQHDFDEDGDNSTHSSSGSVDRRYDKRKSVRLPTIMEGIDGQPVSLPLQQQQQQQQQQLASSNARIVAWQDPDLDDSLMDLDLDSFMMANELQQQASASKAIETAPALPQKTVEKTENVEDIDDEDDVLPYDNKSIENIYKCRKYINSCPDDPYNIDDPHTGGAGVGASSTATMPASDARSAVTGESQTPSLDKCTTTLSSYLHQCNDRVHYHNTRHILEEIRVKLAALLHSAAAATAGAGTAGNRESAGTSTSKATTATVADSKATSSCHVDDVPLNDSAELQHSIQSLRGDLDQYLGIMNATNEQEIRALCTGLSRDHKLVTIQNALGNRLNGHRGGAGNGRIIRCPDRTCSNYAPTTGVDAVAAVSNGSSSASVSTPVGAANSTATTVTAGTGTGTSVSSVYTEREETQFDTVYVRDGFSFGYKSKIPFRLDFTKTQTPVVRTNSNHETSHSVHQQHQQPLPHRNTVTSSHRRQQPPAAPQYATNTHAKFKCSPCSSCEEMMLTTTGSETPTTGSDAPDDESEEFAASTSDDGMRYHANNSMGPTVVRHSQRQYAADMLMRHNAGNYPPVVQVYDTHRRMLVGGGDELKMPFYHQQQQLQLQKIHEQQHQQHQLQHGNIGAAAADYHRNKPSIWEQYYGSNRLNHTAAFIKIIKGQPASFMTYPSERPESDFTLDLPQAEQLRLKMKREKQFRHRCRIVTSFLSLVFFLLTVVAVSLLLTRGKHPFGSMI